MPDPIRSAAAASAIASLIRQAVANTGRARTDTRTTQGARRKGSASGDSQRASLAEVIAARAEELHPDAPDYRQRLLRLVIEAALLHEFGSQLRNAPKFQAMVDQILHELTHAPSLSQDVASVLDTLTSGH